MSHSAFDLPDKELFTIPEVMDFLTIKSPQTIYTYLDQGKLEGVKFSTGTRVTRKSLLEFLRSANR